MTPLGPSWQKQTWSKAAANGTAQGTGEAESPPPLGSGGTELCPCSGGQAQGQQGSQAGRIWQQSLLAFPGGKGLGA